QHRILSQERALAAQRGEQLEQRQAQNRPVVARNPLEKMRAESLDLIGAGAFQRNIADGGEICVDKAFVEPAHSQVRMDDGLKKQLVAARQREAGMEPMRASRKRGELAFRGREIRGFSENLALETARLIRAEDEPSGLRLRDFQRLSARQGQDDRIRFAAVANHLRFDRAFVDLGRRNLEGNRRLRERKPAPLALGGEKQRPRFQPENRALPAVLPMLIHAKSPLAEAWGKPLPKMARKEKPA